MIDTNPVSGDQFKELGRLKTGDESAPGNSREPNGPDLSPTREFAPDTLDDIVNLTRTVNRKMVTAVADLIVSLPDLAGQAHKFESGQMFSVEG
ncbi:hypothetical protein ACFLT7_05745 [candidate division KSB1 bacterium]